MHILISLNTKFPPKSVFSIENGKSELQHWFLLIQINAGTKFQLKLTILIFCTKFTQNGLFLVEGRKSEHHHWILHIRIGLGTKFQLRLTILIFGPNLPKKGVFSLKLKIHIFGGCSSDFAFSYFLRPSKVTEHVTLRVNGGEFKIK